jgi:hypothetical protein
MDILTSLDFLQVGQEFPPPSQLDRLARYRKNKQLFDKRRVIDRNAYNHVMQVMGNNWRVVPYSLLINFYRKISYKTADMLFIEPPVFGAGDDDTKTEVVNQIVLNSTLLDIGRQNAIDTSRFGDGVLVVTEREIDGKMRGVITITQPRYWYPVADPEDLRSIKYHVLAWKVSEKENRISEWVFHVHEKGSVTKYKATLKENVIESIEEVEITDTKFDDFAVLPVQPNLTSDSAFSIDDYTDIEDIVTEIQTRVQQIIKVLDKHAAPALSGPSSALTIDPETGERTVILDNYFTRDSKDDPALEYVVWDAQMDASFKEIDLMMNLLAIISEMGPAIFYDEVLKMGTMSGRALRMLYINALNKVARTRNAFDSVLKRGIYLASQLGYSVKLDRGDVGIKWNDGLPDDPIELAEIGKIRLDSAPSDSVISQIMQQDGLSEKQAREKYERMQEENAQNVPPLNLGGFDRVVNNQDEESVQ